MRLRTLHSLCRFEPYPRPLATRGRDGASALKASSKTDAVFFATAALPPAMQPRHTWVRPQPLLETAVAAWSEVLTVPPPGSDYPNPPTWSAWSHLFATLLHGAAQTPNLVGLDVWLADVQRAQLARRFVPPLEDGPLSVLACRMGAEAGSPRTFNVVRRLLELREALWVARVVPDDVSVDVGCDQKKWQLSGAMAPSSDLAICDASGKVLRRIEVTSLHKPAQDADALRRGLAHILRKAYAEADGATREGCIAIHWDRGVSPRACLEDAVARLNAPEGLQPIWGQVACALDSVTLVDYSPTLAPRVWGRLVKRPSGWALQEELRLLYRDVRRRMSTGSMDASCRDGHEVLSPGCAIDATSG